jgi:hypothetical protein
MPARNRFAPPPGVRRAERIRRAEAKIIKRAERRQSRRERRQTKAQDAPP